MILIVLERGIRHTNNSVWLLEGPNIKLHRSSTNGTYQLVDLLQIPNAELHVGEVLVEQGVVFEGPHDSGEVGVINRILLAGLVDEVGLDALDHGDRGGDR